MSLVFQPPKKHQPVTNYKPPIRGLTYRKRILNKLLFKMSHRDILKKHLAKNKYQGERSCSLPRKKLSLFSPPSPRAVSMAQRISHSAECESGRCPDTLLPFVPKGSEKLFYDCIATDSNNHIRTGFKGSKQFKKNSRKFKTCFVSILTVISPR